MKNRKTLSNCRELNYCFYSLSIKEQENIKQDFYTREFEGIYYRAKATGDLEALWKRIMDKSSPEIRTGFPSELKSTAERRGE